MNIKYSKILCSKKLLMLLIVFLILNNKNAAQLDLTRFQDSAHHWYDINDDDKVILPLSGRPKYKDTEIKNIADNILLFQKDNGGWTKNYDMQAILNSEQIIKVKNAKSKLNTSFDNGATYSQLSYLAEAYSITRDEAYKIAFLKGLDFIFSAQYDNGGWPQFYPDRKGYRKHITYNDGAMIGVMELLHKIVSEDSSYKFIPTDYLSRVKSVYGKGINCILDTQIIEDGKMNVWCQQHDNINLKPQNARTFEPAAICNKESAEIVLFLMKIKNPDERIKQSINSAAKWFEEASLSGIRVKIIESPKVEYKHRTTNQDKILVEDNDAPRVWPRFTELKTHKPLFCRRDGVIVYSLAEVERERRIGYGWYTYDPEKMLKKYSKWLKKWN